MKNIRKLFAMLVCLCMLLSMTALAEETAAETTLPELTGDTVVAVVNGEELLWEKVEIIYNTFVGQYSSYYDMTDPANEELFRTVAVENAVTEMLLMQKAAEMGLAELSAEEKAQVEQNANTDWEASLESYIAYFRTDITAESTEEEVAAARAEAEAYFLENAGYDLQVLTEDYTNYFVMDKVQAVMVQDAVVTDEDVEALYQELLAADKAAYENDVAAYVEYNSQVEMMEMYAAMYGTANEMDYAWYRPEGFRAVKHILLPANEELMAAYTDLQARFEEQSAPVEATEEAAEETAEEPVTEDMISEAKAAIFADLADTIEEINQKIVDGVDFDELIATYGVKADGTPSDPGMVNEPYMTTGYEVSAFSNNFVPEFVEASMSIAEVGGVSAPYLSDYGIHIVKYIADIPGGPIEMTEEQRAAKRQSMLAEKQNELYATTMEQWMSEAAIEYTGVVKSIDELQ